MAFFKEGCLGSTPCLLVAATPRSSQVFWPSLRGVTAQLLLPGGVQCKDRGDIAPSQYECADLRIIHMFYERVGTYGPAQII